MGELTSINAMLQRAAHAIRIQEPEPAPRTCTICGASVPALLIPSGRWIERRCACERAASQQERERDEHRARMKAMAENTYHGWLGKEWLNPTWVREMSHKKFENYDTMRTPEFNKLRGAVKYVTDPEEKEKLQKIIVEFDQWRRTWANALEKAQTFAANPQGVLLLYGEYGLGKTHLLAAVCNSIRHHTPPVSSLFVVTPKFFSAFYDHMQHTHDEWHLVRQACTTKLLVFDDLDKSGPKEFRQETFYQIIDERINANLPMAISTNKMETLESYIGEAAYSRLMAGCVPVELAGKDYRLNLVRK